MSCGCVDKNGKVKTSYDSEQESQEASSYVLEQEDKEVRIYQCEQGFWHLTSQL